MCVAEDEWIGKAWPCYALPVGHMALCQHDQCLNIRDLSQSAGTNGINGGNLSRGATSRTLLLLVWAPWSGPSFYSDCALLPYFPVFLMIYMLGCAFFILPIDHTRVLIFRTFVCFLMWILVTCGILVTWMLFHVFSQSSICFQCDSYSYLITRFCHLGALALRWDWAATWTPGGLVLHFPAKLCRPFLSIWPSSYLYCKDRASGPYQNGYFNHLLFERQIRDFMCSW